MLDKFSVFGRNLPPSLSFDSRVPNQIADFITSSRYFQV